MGMRRGGGAASSSSPRALSGVKRKRSFQITELPSLANRIEPRVSRGNRSRSHRCREINMDTPVRFPPTVIDASAQCEAQIPHPRERGTGRTVIRLISRGAKNHLQESTKNRFVGFLCFEEESQRNRFEGVGKGPIRDTSHLASFCKVALLVLPEPSWISAA